MPASPIRRRKTGFRPPPPSRRPIGTPQHGLSTNTGPLAAAAWLIDRGLSPHDDRWFIEITLAAGSTTFRLEVYAQEWGFELKHEHRVSWIRVTDVAFVHGRDDHQLLRRVPRLRTIELFLVELERSLGVRFDRTTPRIRTSIGGALPALQAWILRL